MPGGWEWLIIIVVLVVLFGAKRLPEMARSVGQSARVFKGEMKGMRDDEGGTTRGAPTSAEPNTRPADPPPAALPRATEQVDGRSGAVPEAGSSRADASPAADAVRRDADR